MKLDRLMSGAFAAAAVALACGCSSTPSPKVALAAPAAVPDVTATTNLMSADLPGPAPKVGKAHLAVDDDGLDAPKETRHSDGSRRGGGFGTTFK